jgi:hypothetical protein
VGSRSRERVRKIAAPFVVAPPTGARVRTRLRLSTWDEAIIWTVGGYLDRLAGHDLAIRCRLGSEPDQRTDRKRALTGRSSSRWAGAITRTSNDQWERARANLVDARAGLRGAVKKIRARVAVPTRETRGRGRGRARGYQTRMERFEKQRRLQHLQARLGEVEARIAAGQVSVCRGGRRLAKLRHAPKAEEGTPALTETEWRVRWQAERLFLTADGEADKRWGNETIRIHPDEHWLEIRLPTPLAHLSNTPSRAPTYRPSCPVAFIHRADEWAAQAASGAIRYDLWFDPARDRWYADASWRLPATKVPSLDELRRDRALGVDLDAEHIDGWVLDPSGNPLGTPHTIPLARGGRRHHPARQSQRLQVAGDGKPRLRRRPAGRQGGTRPRPARQALPPHRRWDPYPAVPRSAGRHGRQRRPMGHRRGSQLDLEMGPAALADPPQSPDKDIDHHHRASCRGGGDRPTRPWAWRPATARCDPTPPEDGERRATGQAWQPSAGP